MSTNLASKRTVMPKPEVNLESKVKNDNDLNKSADDNMSKGTAPVSEVAKPTEKLAEGLEEKSEDKLEKEIVEKDQNDQEVEVKEKVDEDKVKT
jgi:hypothetical protein